MLKHILSSVSLAKISRSLLVVLAGWAFTTVVALPSKAQSPIVTFISAGGPDAEDPDYPGSGPGFDKNFSLTAFRYADGTASGTLVDRWSGPAGTTAIRARIDCVYVVGGTAWVSGEIVQGVFVFEDGTRFDLAGRYIHTAVQDNGNNNDLSNPDRIGFSIQRRRALGPFDCTQMLDDLYDMPRGQVLVR